MGAVNSSPEHIATDLHSQTVMPDPSFPGPGFSCAGRHSHRVWVSQLR